MDYAKPPQPRGWWDYYDITMIIVNIFMITILIALLARIATTLLLRIIISIASYFQFDFFVMSVYWTPTSGGIYALL